MGNLISRRLFEINQSPTVSGFASMHAIYSSSESFRLELHFPEGESLEDTMGKIQKNQRLLKPKVIN